MEILRGEMKRKGGLSREEAYELEEERDLWFGPELDVWEIMIDSALRGEFYFDEESRKFMSFNGTS